MEPWLKDPLETGQPQSSKILTMLARDVKWSTAELTKKPI
jgi:hypothetical protein